MTQFDTSADSATRLGWQIPSLRALFTKLLARRIEANEAFADRSDRFELSRDVADRLAIRSGTRAGNW